MGLFDVLDDLFGDVLGLFGDGDEGGGDDGDRLPARIALGLGSGFAAGAPAPPMPNGPSGLQQGADQAATAYQQASGGVNDTDGKLAELLERIFASNDDARAKIDTIVASIAAARRTLMSNPQLADDPQAMALFNQFVEGQLAQVQQVLDGSKVDGTQRAALLAALSQEYRASTAADPTQKAKRDPHGGEAGGGDGDGDPAGGDGGGTGGAGSDGGGGATTTAGGPGGLIDPLAGLGGAGVGDPLSMLGPAMAGLGAIPGTLGGAAGALPMDGLGAMAPLGSGLAGAGAGDGFHDSDRHGHGTSDDFDDGSPGQKDAGSAKNAEATSGKEASADKNPPTPPAGAPAPQPGIQPASPAAVPASAGADPSRVVAMPDGSAVTATTAQHAAAVRAVLNGSTVSDAWKQGHVELPPPGTPVTAPADPSHLVPGQIAQFKSREPVMYVGGGKIWLDGQLQPQNALPSGDFLGWVDPVQLAGVTAAQMTPGSAAPAGQPAPTTTSGT